MKARYVFRLAWLMILIPLGLWGCGSDGSGSGPVYTPQVRTFFIAADEVQWDYAPQGLNVMMNEPFTPDEEVFVTRIPSATPGNNLTIGSVYKKALYREYTDATFTTLKERPAEWQHLGTLGPVIRGVVGDTIQVVFKNNATLPYTVHPHGVFYAKNSEGAPYDDGTGGPDKADDSVAPGATHTYTWEVTDRAGPGPADGSSVVWLYHSHVDEPADTNAGLVGPIIITKASQANPDGTPKDVDREFITLFTVFDENASWYLDENAAAAQVDPGAADFDPALFEEGNLMHAINGFVYGNMPADVFAAGQLHLAMSEGERTRWYVLGMGTEVDIHTPHWHGNTVLFDQHSTDVIEIMPASMKVVDMLPDNPGIWMFHCHVNDHISAGMITRFEVLP